MRRQWKSPSVCEVIAYAYQHRHRKRGEIKSFNAERAEVDEKTSGLQKANRRVPGQLTESAF